MIVMVSDHSDQSLNSYPSAADLFRKILGLGDADWFVTIDGEGNDETVDETPDWLRAFVNAVAEVVTGASGIDDDEIPVKDIK